MTVRHTVFAAIVACRSARRRPRPRAPEAPVTLDKITSVLATGGHHLGDIVYWTLAEARIDRSTFTCRPNSCTTRSAAIPVAAR